MMSQVANYTSRCTGQLRLVRPCVNNKRSTLRLVRAQALQPSTSKPAIAEFSDSIGLPTDEGLFGFKPFSEVWCGRLAMMGFVSSIAVELQTGKGTLQQIGVGSPSSGLLVALLSVVGIATLGATGYTVFLGATGKLSSRDMERYRKFLLLDNESEEVVSPWSVSTPADKFLAVDNDDQAIAAARSGTSGDVAIDAASSTSSSVNEAAPASDRVSATSSVSYEDKVFGNAELQYARGVETDNGRAAMLGFLSAVLVEAATGKGIVLQLIMWLKIVGLLGPASGF